MLRKLVAAIIGVSALIPSTVFGLGMGEVELKSFLNQPLDARIELLQQRDLSNAEILANLATSKEFSAAGVDRSFFLSTLKFEVIEGKDGKSYLKVSSTRPVTEPFLNFLVEVQWPAGRLLREYTLLLDPPEFKDELPLAIRAPQASVQKSTAGESLKVSDIDKTLDKQGEKLESPTGTPSKPTMAEDKSPKPTPAGQGPVQVFPSASPSKTVSKPAQSNASAKTYSVKAGDTLTSIVKTTMPNADDATTQQAFVAYQYLNPDAFIDNNMNLVKKGAVLRVPTEDDVRQVSRQEAVQEITAQNKAWRAKVRARQSLSKDKKLAGRQLDGTGRELMPAQKPTKTDEGRLSLVTPGADKTNDKGASGRGASEESKQLSALEDQLATQSEQAEKFSVANEGMVSELQELSDLVQKTDRVLSLKDNQIAALQAQLAAIKDEESQAGTEGTNPTNLADPLIENNDSDAEKAAADKAAADKAAADKAAADKAAADEKAKLDAKPIEEPAQDFDEAIVEKDAASILTNPLYLGAAGALILAILGLLWIRSRKDDDEDDDDEFALDNDDNHIDSEHVEGSDDDVANLDGSAFTTEDLDKQMLEAQGDFDLDTVLSEADIYVAYGHFPKAVAMLQGGLKESPNSKALNMKLLEVYAESKQPDEFQEVEAHIRTFAADDDTLGQINALRKDLGLAPGVGPEPTEESFNEEETQFLTEESRVASAADTQDEDFLSLADIEAELVVGGGLDDEDEDESLEVDDDSFDLSDSFEEETTTDSRFVAEDTQVNSDDELDLSSGALDFNFEETSVPEDLPELENFAADETPITEIGSASDSDDDDLLDLSDDLSTFSPDDALADIDEEIGSLNDDFASLDSKPAFGENTGSGQSKVDQAEGLDELDLDNDFTIDEGLLEDTGESSQLSADDASLLDGVDEVTTKLDLASAYIEMGDHEGAKDILDEVLMEGNDDQQQSARELLSKVG